MKTLQKLILPVLIIAAVFLVYKFYFVKGDNLGSFSDFDSNNNAVKEIRVQLLADRGIENSGGGVSFYASDKTGKVENIYGEAQLPSGFESAKVVILHGHLTQSGFHVHEILLD
jgi:cytochrome c-type biogenesis protein CcmE